MTCDFSTVSEAIVQAAQNQQQVRIVGSGCHSGIGFSNKKDAQIIDLKEFHEVNFYSPAELVISAQAGAKLSELSTMLAEKQQRFSCSFRNLSALFGEYSNDATLGGGIAVNLSGSDRVNHYAIRDAVLGMDVINAEGELITMGGRVFKNVTGYDLSKLIIGSLGTLGVIASINMRLRPLAECESSLLIDGLNIDQAIDSMAQALNSPFDVCGAYAKQIGEDYQVFLRIEGFAESVQERLQGLKNLLKNNNLHAIADKDSSDEWLSINNLSDFSLAQTSNDIWLLSQPASQATQVVHALRALSPNSVINLDWGGGQIWCASPDNLSASDIRQACHGFGATLQPIRVPAEQAKGAFAFDSGSKKLIHQLYQEFDPQNIFQRQRLYGDF